VRWVLLDEVVKIERQKQVHARARVPETDVSPEVLMIEMMAQTGALLLGAESDFRQDLVFAKIQNADFPLEFTGGEKIDIRATSDNLRPEGAWITASIESERGTVAQANLMLMTVGHFLPGIEEPITFHQAFMQHYQIREKVN
jgi:3-hydroxymyristoyl/3-hydroxydecanoyl-(acyl carrier protein) dehydratase